MPGLRVEEFWPLPEGATVRVRGAVEATADLWSQALDLEGAEAVARFADGELAGRPAVTRQAYGQSAAWYVATRLEPAAMRSLTDAVRAEARVEPVVPDLPDGVQAARRTGARGRWLFPLNHGSRTARLALPEPLRDALAPGGPLLEHIDLPAREVAVLSDAPPPPAR